MSMNRKRIILNLCLIALVAFVLKACLDNGEREIAETEVPTAILEAFKEAYPGAVVREYGEELEDGDKAYEISFTHKGQKIDILYAQDGNVIELEETIPAAELPAAIHDELNDRFDQYEIKETEKITKGADIFYEVRLTATSDEKAYELIFSQDGRLISQEQDDDADDGEEEEEGEDQ